MEAPRAGRGLRDLQGESEGAGTGWGWGKHPNTHTEGLSGRACVNQPPSRPRPATTPGLPRLAIFRPLLPPTTRSLAHPQPGWLRTLVQAPQSVPFSSEGGQDAAERAVHCGGRAGIRLPSSPSPSPTCSPPPLQLTLTLLGQGPEAALQVGIVWGRQPSGARGVSGLQVARQVGN